eukprot:gnl/Spiro4/15965_TR8584_c0_g1_i1.p1 gnl/Spiro4/15965_TR8584_c0_g1~~gnl/Spiro4/15965_TR8584_c0_g1_i1.p1  ORF type:complete len:3185 (+),score=1015.68 gnl/Spiro4/15965_TR8584_c0_g1_i1:139-9555(+)
MDADAKKEAENSSESFCLPGYNPASSLVTKMIVAERASANKIGEYVELVRNGCKSKRLAKSAIEAQKQSFCLKFLTEHVTEDLAKDEKESANQSAPGSELLCDLQPRALATALLTPEKRVYAAGIEMATFTILSSCAAKPQDMVRFAGIINRMATGLQMGELFEASNGTVRASFVQLQQFLLKAFEETRSLELFEALLNLAAARGKVAELLEIFRAFLSSTSLNGLDVAPVLQRFVSANSLPFVYEGRDDPEPSNQCYLGAERTTFRLGAGPAVLLFPAHMLFSPAGLLENYFEVTYLEPTKTGKPVGLVLGFMPGDEWRESQCTMRNGFSCYHYEPDFTCKNANLRVAAVGSTPPIEQGVLNQLFRESSVKLNCDAGEVIGVGLTADSQIIITRNGNLVESAKLPKQSNPLLVPFVVVVNAAVKLNRVGPFAYKSSPPRPSSDDTFKRKLLQLVSGGEGAATTQISLRESVGVLLALLRQRAATVDVTWPNYFRPSMNSRVKDALVPGCLDVCPETFESILEILKSLDLANNADAEHQWLGAGFMELLDCHLARLSKLSIKAPSAGLDVISASSPSTQLSVRIHQLASDILRISPGRPRSASALDGCVAGARIQSLAAAVVDEGVYLYLDRQNQVQTFMSLLQSASSEDPSSNSVLLELTSRLSERFATPEFAFLLFKEVPIAELPAKLVQVFTSVAKLANIAYANARSQKTVVKSIGSYQELLAVLWLYATTSASGLAMKHAELREALGHAMTDILSMVAKSAAEVLTVAKGELHLVNAADFHHSCGKCNTKITETRLHNPDEFPNELACGGCTKKFERNAWQGFMCLGESCGHWSLCADCLKKTPETLVEARLNVLAPAMYLSPGGLLSPILLSLQDVGCKELLFQHRDSLPRDTLAALSSLSGELSELFPGGEQIVEIYHESAHNYSDNMDVAWEMHIPGASSLTITFDPRSITENGCDYLDISSTRGGPNIGHFTGPSGESWTRGCVIPGPIAYCKFHSDGSVNAWGWRMIVRGNVEGNEGRSFLQSLQSKCVSLDAQLIKHYLLDDSTEDDQVRKWLDHRLFASGLQESALPHLEAGTFVCEDDYLAGLIGHPAESFEKIKPRLIAAKIDPNLPAPAELAVQATVAAVLKLTRLVPAAMVFAGDAPVAHPDMVTIYQLVVTRMRTHFRERQGFIQALRAARMDQIAKSGTAEQPLLTLEDCATAIANKARILLMLSPWLHELEQHLDGHGAAAESAGAPATVKRSFKGLASQMRQSAKASLPAASKISNKWLTLVNAVKVQQLCQQYHDRNFKPDMTSIINVITVAVLQFLLAEVKSETVMVALRARLSVARDRAWGLSCISRTLATQSTDANAVISALSMIVPTCNTGNVVRHHLEQLGGVPQSLVRLVTQQRHDLLRACCASLQALLPNCPAQSELTNMLVGSLALPLRSADDFAALVSTPTLTVLSHIAFNGAGLGDDQLVSGARNVLRVLGHQCLQLSSVASAENPIDDPAKARGIATSTLLHVAHDVLTVEPRCAARRADRVGPTCCLPIVPEGKTADPTVLGYVCAEMCGARDVAQFLWTCTTCAQRSGTEKFLCCQSCKNRCHKGHQMGPKEFVEAHTQNCACFGADSCVAKTSPPESLPMKNTVYTFKFKPRLLHMYYRAGICTAPIVPIPRQHWFTCTTCNGGDDKPKIRLCGNCASQCHSGEHHVLEQLRKEAGDEACSCSKITRELPGGATFACCTTARGIDDDGGKPTDMHVFIEFLHSLIVKWNSSPHCADVDNVLKAELASPQWCQFVINLIDSQEGLTQAGMRLAMLLLPLQAPSTAAASAFVARLFDQVGIAELFAPRRNDSLFVESGLGLLRTLAKHPVWQPVIVERARQALNDTAAARAALAAAPLNQAALGPLATALRLLDASAVPALGASVTTVDDKTLIVVNAEDHLGVSPSQIQLFSRTNPALEPFTEDAVVSCVPEITLSPEVVPLSAQNATSFANLLNLTWTNIEGASQEVNCNSKYCSWHLRTLAAKALVNCVSCPQNAVFVTKPEGEALFQALRTQALQPEGFRPRKYSAGNLKRWFEKINSKFLADKNDATVQEHFLRAAPAEPAPPRTEIDPTPGRPEFCKLTGSSNARLFEFLSDSSAASTTAKLRELESAWIKSHKDLNSNSAVLVEGLNHFHPRMLSAYAALSVARVVNSCVCAVPPAPTPRLNMSDLLRLLDDAFLVGNDEVLLKDLKSSVETWLGAEPQLLSAVVAEALQSLRSVVCVKANPDAPAAQVKHTFEWESAHPYASNTHNEITIDEPLCTAEIITVKFDPRCATEENCDYLQFGYNAPGSGWTNLRQFTGRVNHSNYNPTGGWKVKIENPEKHPLKMLFHSDGSVEDWGYKITLSAKVEGGSASKKSVAFGLYLIELLSRKFGSHVPPAALDELADVLLRVYAHSPKQPDLIKLMLNFFTLPHPDPDWAEKRLVDLKFDAHVRAALKEVVPTLKFMEDDGNNMASAPVLLKQALCLFTALSKDPERLAAASSSSAATTVSSSATATSTTDTTATTTTDAQSTASREKMESQRSYEQSHGYRNPVPCRWKSIWEHVKVMDAWIRPAPNKPFPASFLEKLRNGPDRTETPTAAEAGIEDYQWSLRMDLQVVELALALADRNKSNPMELVHRAFTEQFAVDMQHILNNIAHLSVKAVQRRYDLIVRLNKRIWGLVPWIDLQSEQEWNTLGFMFGRLKGLCLDTKTRSTLIRRTLEETNAGNSREIIYNRIKAAKYANDPSECAANSLFGQALEALRTAPGSTWRVTGNNRMFSAKFQGEGSTDAGGPYREVFSTFTNELMSSVLPCLIKSPNNAHHQGDNRESWMVNPKSTSAKDLEYFNFMGKIFGLAFRTELLLNLYLPPLFWKQMCGEVADLTDLRGIDSMCVQVLEQLRTIESQGVDDETFQDMFALTWTTTLSDQSEFELVPGGASMPVHLKDVGRYCELVAQTRINEARAQMEAVRQGFGAVVPLSLLAIVPWNELETRICGAADFSCDVLKEKTEYQGGYSASDPTIQIFWNVLENDFTAKERTLFLKFVWGQSRLPADGNFSDRFKIQGLSKSGDPNNLLPESHTCFFTLDLPRYTSRDACKRKLLLAITLCGSIDNDFAGDTSAYA